MGPLAVPERAAGRRAVLTHLQPMSETLAAPFRAIEAASKVAVDSPFVVLRLDGKGFSKWTKSLDRPCDQGFLDAMRVTTEALVRDIPGVRLGYVVSDEISLVLDYRDLLVEQTWFGGRSDKMLSLSASMATAHFNAYGLRPELAFFDSRLLPLDSEEQVLDYLNWRRADGVRNAVHTAAHVAFGHSRLMGVPHAQKIEMLAAAGRPVSDLPTEFLRGSIIYREQVMREVTFTDRRVGQEVSKVVPRTVVTSSVAQGSFALPA